MADAYAYDLIVFNTTLELAYADWESLSKDDIGPEVWASFWRLVQVSLEDGCTLPHPITWMDRLALAKAMSELNLTLRGDALGEVEALTAITARARTKLTQGQGRILN